MCKQRNWRYIQCETESWYYFRIKIETELLIVMTRNCDSTKIFEKNYFIYYIRKYKASKVACYNFYKKNTAIKITVDHQDHHHSKSTSFILKDGTLCMYSLLAQKIKDLLVPVLTSEK